MDNSLRRHREGRVRVGDRTPYSWSDQSCRGSVGIRIRFLQILRLFGKLRLQATIAFRGTFNVHLWLMHA